MEHNNNINSSNSDNDHHQQQQQQQQHHETNEAFNAKARNAIINTATHPLEDIDLSLDENMPEMQSTITTTTSTNQPATASAQRQSTNKENWVKFDDDVNEISENIRNNNNDSSNNNSHSNSSSANDSKDTAVAAAATNKLSTPLPLLPPPTTTTRPRTPIENKNQQQQQTAAPVQRSTISSTSMPDVAPAVLTTESTHVNLNASGKALQQQHHHQQHHHLQQQQQLQQEQQHHPKPKATTAATNVLATTTSSSSNNIISSSPHTQLPHHSSSNNNGTTTTSSTTSAMQKSTTNTVIPVELVQTMRTIELSTGRIREGFANGDVIVTLLPANTKWPWITPAIFRPELVPEELMAQGLTLTVEEYVNAMETLVNDYRFTIYNICYKRILVCWILFAFAVLLTLLFSGLQGVALFSLGVGWLFLNAAAIFLCMWMKLRLSRGLEKCLARVNKQLMRHKILLVLDDRGRISCHKVNLCFLYFDATQCVSFLNEFLEHTEQNGGETIKAGWEAKLDIDMNDIVIQGNNPVRLSRKQAVAQELFLSYLQRWGKDFLRRRLDWTVQEAGVHETPRHLQSSICPCQYEEEVLRNKIKTHLKRNQCCGINCLSCWM